MRPISVLLVDDNPTFLRILKRFLEEGYQDEVVVVGTAGGGQEALAKVRKLRPRIVLLDLAMPGMNGLVAIPSLRSILPDLGIIALTLLSTDGYRRAALAAGADEFVAKAELNTHLLPAIRRVACLDRSPAMGMDGSEAGRAPRVPGTNGQIIKAQSEEQGR